MNQPTFALRGGQTMAYHVDGLMAEGDAKAPMVYDFAIGQNQNAMNAGFVPPDRSSLVGQAGSTRTTMARTTPTPPTTASTPTIAIRPSRASVAYASS